MNEVFLPSGAVPRAGTVATGSDTSQPVRSCMWISPSTPSLALHPARPSHVQGMQNHYISISLCLSVSTGAFCVAEKSLVIRVKIQIPLNLTNDRSYPYLSGRKSITTVFLWGYRHWQISQSTRTTRHGRWPR